MLYNAFDTKFSRLIKQMIFWLSLAAMLGLCAILLSSETKLPQHKISINIDIKDKINICTPSKEKGSDHRKLYDL